MRVFFAAAVLFMLVIFGCSNEKAANDQQKDTKAVSVKDIEKTPVALSKSVPFQLLSKQMEVWNGCLDMINSQGITGAVTKVSTGRVRLTGWFADTDRGIPPVKAAFYFKNESETYYVEIPIYILRLDVIEAFKKSNLGNTGFDEIVDITALPPGKYEMGLLGQTKNYCGKLDLNLAIEK